MRKFLKSLLAVSLTAALAINSVAATTVVAAPLGNPFLKGVKDPTELADIFDANLARDETGMTMLNPARCKRDGSCARPVDYLEVLQKSDPAANLKSVKDLPRYFRSLKAIEPPQGEYWMACLVPAGNGLWKPKDRCLKRTAKKGEMWWVNPVTGKIALAQDCTNPIIGPDAPCYVFSFNYEERRDVVTVNGSAVVSAHMSIKAERLQQIWYDECFFVSDETGKYKPTIQCGLICPPGSEWPQLALAQAVGIPEIKPASTFWFDLAGKKGYLSVPRYLLDEVDESVFCVYVEIYPISAKGYEGYRSLARFNVVHQRELLRTKKAGKLDRVLKGEQHY